MSTRRARRPARHRPAASEAPRARAPRRACRREHLDARAAPGRARVRDVGQRARRARRCARVLAPGAIELERHARAELGRRPARDHAAGVEVDEPLAGLDLVEVAGADQDQHRVAALLEQLPDLAARDDVDARRRLVEHQQLGLGQQRVRDRELLLHAAGERARGPIGEGRQPGAREQLVGSQAPLARLEAMQARGERRFSTTDSSRCRLKTCGT